MRFPHIGARLSAALTFSLALCCTLSTAGAEVVINEIHYNGEPNNAANEFVELHNTGAEAVDLAGWFFNSGIDYTFPPDAEIAGGGYLAIAERPSALLSEFGVTALGPFGGQLAGDGETLELRRADGTVADTVTYKAKFPWPVGAGGTGASMELINPALDNDLGGAWRSSTVPGVLSELTLLPASDSGWRWRPGASEASSPADAWRAGDFVEDGTWTAKAMPIGYGIVNAHTFSPPIAGMRGNYTSIFLRNEFTVAPGEVPPALLFRFLADDGLIIWINGIEVVRENLPAGDLSLSASALLNANENTWLERTVEGAAGFVVEGVNTIALQLFNSSVSSSDCGIDLELIRPASGVGAPPQPTPGARSSTFAANAPPFIRQVEHTPKQPVAGEATTITAKVTDPDGVAAVTLEVQKVAPGAYVPAFLAKPTALLRSSPNSPRDPNPAYHDAANWSAVAMVDDGSGGDVLAGDGVYTAVLPGEINRMLVRYRITVEDALGAAVRVPYADDESLNFAYFVYDGVPDYVADTRSVLGAPHTYPAALIESIPVYHVITTPADFDQAVAYDGADQISRDLYDARSAYNWNCTFVYNGEVYDNVEYRLRQRNARYSGSGKRSFKFRFQRGSYPTFRDMEGDAYQTEWKFLATHKMRGSRGDYTWGIEQAANHILWNMTGTPAPFTHWFHMRVVRGAEEAPTGANGQYLGDYYGMLLAMEEYDVRFLDAHNLEKGNLYKLISGRTDGVSVRRYLARDAVDDGSDFQNIIFQLRPDKDDAWLNRYVNYDSWNHYHAIVDAIRHYDVQPNTGEHLKNRAYYFEPSAEDPQGIGRLWVLPWDSDTSWGPNWNGGEDFCKAAIYNTNPPRPDFMREYRNVVREIRDLIWTEEQISLLIDPLAERIAPLVPADRDRWTGAVGGSESAPPMENWIATMKQFAFVGGSWVGGDSSTMEPISRDTGISGQQGRDAYLDALGADGAIPDTPSIAYAGAEGYPQGGLAFQSSAFSDPQGAGTFGAMEWRIAEVTPVGGGTFPVLNAGASWRFLDDGSDQGSVWREVGFDDSAWATGDTPAGYGGVNGLTFSTVIDFGPETINKYITTYFRTTVDVADPSLIDHFTISILVDDAAVIYVNGQEVLREGIDAGVNVAFDTRANGAGNENTFDTFEIPPSAFVAGENLIAVEVHQELPSSSDMGFELSMSATELLIPPGGNVRFEWNADWESGELSPFAADIAPPAAAVSVGKTYRARVRHEDNTGRWSHWSAPVEFTVAAPSIDDWLQGLVVSEFMYHPAAPTAGELAVDPTLVDEDFEWVEIMNVGAAALDLTDVRFTKGVEFDFVTGSKTSIAPGERLVVVGNEAAFNLRYGFAATPAFVVGRFAKNLANGGERLKLSFGGGTAIRDFIYSDTSPWPSAADGLGPSLVLIAPETVPDHADPASWRASSVAGGRPGESDPGGGFSGDPLGDDNGNGIPNLVEYAAGAQFVVGMVEDGGNMYPSVSFDLNPAAADAVVTVEASGDLLEWRSGAGEIVLFSQDGVTQTWRTVQPAGDEGSAEFLRVRVDLQ